jgi:hypothetical protein
MSEEEEKTILRRSQHSMSSTRKSTIQRPREVNLVVGLGIFTVVAAVLYWTAWFFAPETIQARGPGEQDYQIYVNFEQAFPLADSWLAIAALIGVVGLWKMRAWGFLFGLLAGSAGIFLGLMDLLYDLQHNMLVPFTSQAGTEFVIVLLLLLLGPLQIYLLWRRRRMFIK